MDSSGKLDLNVVGVHHLTSIKGIGQGRAEAIVRYRDKNGRFASTDDLDRVPHVGDMPPHELAQVKQRLVVLPLSQQQAGDHESEKVDVNQANIVELRQVPGIGEAHADAIVSYREERGGIKDLGELDPLPHFRDQSFLERQRIKSSLKV
jgi:competence ComEA-like helix-hairpin-helix protein